MGIDRLHLISGKESPSMTQSRLGTARNTLRRTHFVPAMAIGSCRGITAELSSSRDWWLDILVISPDARANRIAVSHRGLLA